MVDPPHFVFLCRLDSGRRRLRHNLEKPPREFRVHEPTHLEVLPLLPDLLHVLLHRRERRGVRHAVVKFRNVTYFDTKMFQRIEKWVIKCAPLSNISCIATPFVPVHEEESVSGGDGESGTKSRVQFSIYVRSGYTRCCSARKRGTLFVACFDFSNRPCCTLSVPNILLSKLLRAATYVLHRIRYSMKKVSSTS